ncbi:hypothetical protein DFJ73DRAFT_899595, partial [Zopfochytrium polystomum]
QDDSLNNSFWFIPVTSVNDVGKLTFAPPKFRIKPHLAAVLTTAVNGFWRPDRAAGPNTFILAFNIPVWKGRFPFKTPPSEPPAASFFSLLTVRSLDEYLQKIPMTPNGVLALVHGDNGMMFGATTPNISEAWPNQYPAIGNPNPLVSAAAAEIVRRYSTLDPAVNGTAAISGIADRTGKSFSFSFAGDTVYCNTAWIVDTSANLALLLVLAVPSSDFLGPVNVTIRNTIIFVAVFCVFALLLGVLLSWALATKFDFSTLQSDVAAGHSWIVEIAKLEGSFFTMLKKFAEAVRSNKALVTGGASTQRKSMAKE